MSQNIKGKLNPTSSMTGNLNKDRVPINYTGLVTDTASVIVDKAAQTIKVNVLGGTGESKGSVLYSTAQNLTDEEKNRALLNIGAQKKLVSQIEPGTYQKITVDSNGLAVAGSTDVLKLEDLDVPEIDLRYVRLQADELQTINSPVSIIGNLKIEGSIEQTGLATQYVRSTKDVIVLRHNNPSGLKSGEYTGIAAHNYNGEGRNGYLVFDNKGVARVGGRTITDPLKPLAARDEVGNLEDGKFTYWNSEGWLIKTRNVTPEDINSGLLSENPTYYPKEPKDYTTKDYVDAEVSFSGHYRLVDTHNDLTALNPYSGLRVFVKEDAVINA